MQVQTKANHGTPFISIRNKLLFIFLIPTIMLLSINAYINAEINTMIDDISGIYASNTMLNELQISLTQVHRYLETFLDTRDTEAIEGYLRNQQEFSNRLERLNGRLLDDDSMITQKNIRSISEEYIRTADRAVEAKRGRNVVKYKEYYDDADRLFSYINSYIYSLNNRQLQRNSQNYEALFTSLKYSETANLTILCMTSALVTLLVFLLTRGITDPLRRLAEAAEQVAHGSLIAEVSGPVANDEVGIVTAAFNQMVASLKDNMEQARQRIELESAMKEKQLLMEAHLKDTQLKYLQSQINPHFLFNTLNACAQLAMLEEADRTYTYVQNANGSVEEQVKLMEYFIQKKVDAIVIVPIDSAPLLETVQKAQSSNIKVIAYDRLIVGAQPDLYITFDNRKVGELMAQTLLSDMETTADLLMICGPLTDHNVLEVEEGFLSEIQGKDVSVLDTYYTDGWKPENAGAYIREHRELAQSVSGIMCGNDNLAGAVVDALAEQRLAGKVRVVGQDGDLAACQRIVEGTQSMTVYKPVDKLASRAAQETVRLIQGETLECEYYFTEDGDQIPYIRLAPVAVTQDNMQSVIIDSGFHLKEDVYLNRPDLMSP